MSAVVATIPVGGMPNGIALRSRSVLLDALVGPAQHQSLYRYPHAYVSNLDGSVAVIRTSDNTVIKTIPDIKAAAMVKISRNGARAYVLRWGGITAIDTATNAVVADIPYEPPLLLSFAVSPDQSRLYLVPPGENLEVVDTVTHTVTASFRVGATPAGVEISPDGTRVYVADFSGNTVSVVDTATNTVSATIAVGSNPQHLTVSPDGARVYVVNSIWQAATGSVSVIDTASRTVIATIPVGARPAGVALSPNGKRLYVANQWEGVTVVDGKAVAEHGGTISEISTSSNKVIDTITVGGMPTGVAVSPDSKHVYVTNSLGGTVSVIEIRSELQQMIDTRILQLIAEAKRIDGSWMVIGSKVIPIPPHPPTVAALAKAAAPNFDDAFDSPEIAARLRRLSGGSTS